MKKALNELIEKICENVNECLATASESTFNYVFKLSLLLDVYNNYQECERDGVDYIFNINKREDVKVCLDGGVTMRQLSALYQESQVNTTPFFFFGTNYPKPQAICTYKQLQTILTTDMREMVKHVLKNITAECNSRFYDMFVASYVICL